MPKIIQQLGDFQAPFDLEATVRRLLASVPPKYLAGLGSVVLTTSGQLSSRARKQVFRYESGQRMRIGDSMGNYRQAAGTRPAVITLLCDNLLAGCRRGYLRLPIFRDLAVSACLYHEIGHHVHATQRPNRKDGEVVAERWRFYLFGLHWRRHYRWLRPLWPLIRRIANDALARASAGGGGAA